MRRIFNMGIGLILVVEEKKLARAIEVLKKACYDAHPVGRIERGTEGVRYA